MGEIRSFYEGFASGFIDDYIRGNERVQKQCQFFSRIIPEGAAKILVLGCGSGETAFYVASKVAPHAYVMAVDISSAAIRIANVLFRHDRIEYRQADVTEQTFGENWDVVILPDVYEHIPRDGRKTLHSRLDRLLATRGTLLLTVPSPAKQVSLRRSGKGLQLVDETVTLADMNELAHAVHGTLTYFNLISVWERNDYIHAAIQRGADESGPIDPVDRVPIKGWPRRTLSIRGREFLLYHLRFFRLLEFTRRWRVRRRLPRGQ